ncbi:carbonic anhydrase [Sphingomonas abietis]|uniref:Carbonic anhydrase n=1 Tax=Sphingomonas abietis TaxID=3012344 RepID=A0ABY7NRR8_9SPHN|nr:carbonic anhydrase [Sphingomonas abietis]WBO24236.1 carbonic anhydrase [Sphingomonas abietis]
MPGFDDLLAGYRRFHREAWATQRARWSELADGQAPDTLVIACSDSRVDPAQIFDVAPGNIFVVRNIANLVPPFEPDTSRHGVSAAVEFAVTQLMVSEIVVLGHEYCGGCKAAMSQVFAGAAPGEGGFVGHWVDMLDPARDAIIAAHGDGEQAERALEREAVKVSLANLRSFPFVTAAESAGRLTLRGAWFGIREGQLQLLGEGGAFHPA